VRQPSLTLQARHLLPISAPPIEGGWLRIDRGRIVALGKGRPPGPAIDLGDAIILPGLVNAHTHLEFSTVSQPLTADGGLPAWISRVVALRRQRPSDSAAAETAVAVARGRTESAAAGVTAVGEIATAASLDAYAAPGPRVRVFREALGLSPAAGAAAFTAALRDLDRLAARGIPAGVSPHAPYSVAASLGSRLLATACARCLPAAMHLAESRAEEDLLARGIGPFRDLLESLGAWPAAAPPRLLSAADWISRLARGPRGIVVHGTHLDRDPVALARLARHRDRLAVAICPRTTRAISGVLPPLASFREAGLRVAIGTDSRASNPDLSVLAECRTLVDAGLTSPAAALTMATLHGAWAMMLDHQCGSLAAGRAADLAILQPATPHADPFTAALAPDTRLVATLRAGRVIAGCLPGLVPAAS
jgi:cytosine/adenosine deaminase-related metal-dependent hydrolase